MFNKKLNVFNIFITGTLVVCVYLCVIRFFIPALPTLQIDTVQLDYNAETQRITLKVDNPPAKYYILCYENLNQSNWIYHNSSPQSSNNTIKNLFLANSDTGKYVFFEGNSSYNTFSFDIVSKYSLSYMSNKEYIFHAQVIIPFKFLFLPVFYYSTHYTFFIEPI